MLDLGKTRGMINMEKTILEMQQNLREGYYVVFVSTDEEQYFPLTKSDTLSFLEDNRLAIRSKSGMVRIINLDLIIEICIRRFDSYV